VGIFTETRHFYPAESRQHEEYGAAVVASRGPKTSWEDWAEQLASKTPSPLAMWDLYDHAPADLHAVLIDAIAALEWVSATGN
jgi:hypothetical protein